ncbi:MAG: hypothetical protein HC932_02365 [Thermales bacterium]|nr:hypothetical protein [Thermales bacterium]
MDTSTTLSQVISSEFDNKNPITIRSRQFKDGGYEIADNVKSSADLSRMSYQLRNNEFIDAFYGRAGKYLGNKLYDVDIKNGKFDVVAESLKVLSPNTTCL